MLVGQFATNKKKKTECACVGGAKYPTPPQKKKKKKKIMKKIAQPAEFRLKYANTLIHVHKNVCLNGFYFSILL